MSACNCGESYEPVEKCSNWGKTFCYSLENNKSDVFSQGTLAVFSLTFNHFCYEELDALYHNKLFAHVKRIDADTPITYGQVFDAIDTQIGDQLAQLELVIGTETLNACRYIGPTIVCNHRFIETLTKVSPIVYEIGCGS